jgi:hypothetical protein
MWPAKSSPPYKHPPPWPPPLDHLQEHHGKDHGLHLVEASKTVSALTRCNRTTTWRSALDTDAACGRPPLRCSARSLVECS